MIYSKPLAPALVRGPFMGAARIDGIGARGSFLPFDAISRIIMDCHLGFDYYMMAQPLQSQPDSGINHIIMGQFSFWVCCLCAKGHTFLMANREQSITSRTLDSRTGTINQSLELRRGHFFFSFVQQGLPPSDFRKSHIALPWGLPAAVEAAAAEAPRTCLLASQNLAPVLAPMIGYLRCPGGDPVVRTRTVRSGFRHFFYSSWGTIVRTRRPRAGHRH